MAIMNESISPPAFNKDIEYTNWKKDLQIWESSNSIDKVKRAPAVYQFLTGEAKQVIRNLNIDKLTCDDGIRNITETLDKMYLKDESILAYEAYETFEKFIRHTDMSMNDFVNKFEDFYSKAKNYKMEILDGVLAYRLLNNANLSEDHKQLIKATMIEMSYKSMKDQLKKVFTAIKSEKPIFKEECEVKTENSDIYYNDNNLDEEKYEKPYYNNYRGKRRPYVFRARNNNNTRGTFRGRFNDSKNRRASFSQYSDQKPILKSQNPLDRYGHIMHCSICSSTFHFAKECPEVNSSANTEEQNI